jgi:3-methyladenine DNA glycosylase AlkD
MAARKTVPSGRLARTAESSSTGEQVDVAVASLKRMATKKVRDGMARYGLPSEHALGVSVGDIQKLAKSLGRNHGLALALWETGLYECRMLAAYVDEPDRVTPSQMDRWCRDFDNWGICDTVCFAMFDRTKHAWSKVRQWANRREEFVKRAAFALLWGLTVHDKQAGDEPFLEGLAIVELSATDERHFVKKSVNMALRAIGKRNRPLNRSAVTLARRLAATSNDTARWIGKDALRELDSSSVKRRLAARD